MIWPVQSLILILMLQMFGPSVRGILSAVLSPKSILPQCHHSVLHCPHRITSQSLTVICIGFHFYSELYFITPLLFIILIPPPCEIVLVTNSFQIITLDFLPFTLFLNFWQNVQLLFSHLLQPENPFPFSRTQANGGLDFLYLTTTSISIIILQLIWL